MHHLLLYLQLLLGSSQGFVQSLPVLWCCHCLCTCIFLRHQSPAAWSLRIRSGCLLCSAVSGKGLLLFLTASVLRHEMATLPLLPWKSQLQWSNRASKPGNVQVPWQSRSANPALARNQQCCVVRNWLQCLWGITISLRIMEKGVSGFCNVGSYRGCPRQWTY